METWVKFRNKLIGLKYRWVLKPILFLFDPEWVHDLFIKIGVILGSNALTRWATRIWFYYENPILKQEILGIKFKNPIGLAAGFDKNARLTQVMPEVGFGFMEIGSVTGRPCSGNEGKHLWRLPKSKSLIVYYGLTNDGAEPISKRLAEEKFAIPVGISLAKTNDQETITTEAGIKDYLMAYQAFLQAGVGNYFTINISCPNTFGGEPFVEAERLNLLLSAFAKIREESSDRPKPVFIKLPPDLDELKLDEIIALARKFEIDGFISANLTKDRGNPLVRDQIKDFLPTDKGGLSGQIAKGLADKQIRYIYQKAGKEFVIIGCGGISTAQDAYEKIKAGASLLQLITSMIYEGPQVVSEINQGLAELLKQDGYKNISEAIGKQV